ncbi:MAG: hypothetical protein AAF721_05220 [Myxococcota bacterium]
MPASTTLDDALHRVRGELSVLSAAGGGIPSERAEQAMTREDLTLTLVTIRVADSDPRPVMHARLELHHGRSGEGRVLQVFVPVASSQPSPGEVDKARQEALREAVQQLLGTAAREAPERARRPTVELPDIGD